MSGRTPDPEWPPTGYGASTPRSTSLENAPRATRNEGFFHGHEFRSNHPSDSARRPPPGRFSTLPTPLGPSRFVALTRFLGPEILTYGRFRSANPRPAPSTTPGPPRSPASAWRNKAVATCRRPPAPRGIWRGRGPASALPIENSAPDAPRAPRTRGPRLREADRMLACNVRIDQAQAERPARELRATCTDT